MLGSGEVRSADSPATDGGKVGLVGLDRLTQQAVDALAACDAGMNWKLQEDARRAREEAKG